MWNYYFEFFLEKAKIRIKNTTFEKFKINCNIQKRKKKISKNQITKIKTKNIKKQKITKNLESGEFITIEKTQFFEKKQKFVQKMSTLKN